MIDKYFDNTETPSPRVFKLAMNRICKSCHRNMASTYKIAQRLVETQETVFAREKEALDYMIVKMEKERVQTDPEYYKNLVNSYTMKRD